ncbi:MAG: NTPase [Acidobacteriota bacterium]
MEIKGKNILLMGLPGVGKTTVIEKVVERLKGKGIVSGFYTSEIREAGSRSGFKIRTIDGKEGVLSHINIRSRARVGRYCVDVRGFEELVLPLLNGNLKAKKLIVIDEIGKMECLSKLFCEAVTRALDSVIPVLATIALKGGGFIQEVKSRPDVTIIEVTRENRNSLPDILVSHLSSSTF